MRERPKSITVIAWFLIVTGASSVFTILISLNNPEIKELIVKELIAKSSLPIYLQYAMVFVGVAVTIANGIGMLKGQGWARLLYIVWGVFGFLVGLVASPMKAALIPGAVIFAIIVFFLYRPEANQYFTKA